MATPPEGNVDALKAAVVKANASGGGQPFSSAPAGAQQAQAAYNPPSMYSSTLNQSHPMFNAVHNQVKPQSPPPKRQIPDLTPPGVTKQTTKAQDAQYMKAVKGVKRAPRSKKH